jgi:hypothetical protein
MQDSTVTAIETQVDKEQYSEDELISIKTTLNLPYYTSSAEYERAYGSINIDGQDYEYVKRRVYNDTLELLCIPNGAKTKLQSINNDLAKTSAGGGASTPDKKSHTVLKIALPDFCQSTRTYLTSFVSNTKQDYYSSNTLISLAGYTSRQERPPQSMQHFIS